MSKIKELSGKLRSAWEKLSQDWYNPVLMRELAETLAECKREIPEVLNQWLDEIEPALIAKHANTEGGKAAVREFFETLYS